MIYQEKTETDTPYTLGQLISIIRSIENVAKFGAPTDLRYQCLDLCQRGIQIYEEYDARLKARIAAIDAVIKADAQQNKEGQ